MIPPRIRWALSLVEYAEALPETARLRRAVLVAIAVALVCALLAVAPVAEAQADHVLLARTCVSEAGWMAPQDCAAIAAVIQGIADRDGVSFRRAWALASPRLAECSVSRRWLCGLVERCTEPADWPRVVVERDGRVRPHPPWSSYRARCLAVMDSAAFILAHPGGFCRELPRSWGDDRDVRIRERISAERTWVDVDCGETILRFGAWVEVDVE